MSESIFQHNENEQQITFQYLKPFSILYFVFLFIFLIFFKYQRYNYDILMT